MILNNPWLLILIPILTALFIWLNRKDYSSSIKFSSGELIKGFKPTFKLILAKNLMYLWLVALCLIVVALARPRQPLEEAMVETEGIDIVMAIDASGSMLAEDFKIGNQRENRLDVVKKVAEEFIEERKTDRIGIVAFAARAYTVCPLTLDHQWLIKNLERIKIGSIEDGTAIGSAISSSLNRLKDTEAKSKIIILLTDGVNNAGKISPLTAAQVAKALGIKIYTIGVGSKGLVPYPVQDLWDRTVYQNVQIDIDEAILKKIADETDGKYYRATDTESLREIYKEIDSLEKITIEETGFYEYKELFPNFLIPGLLIIIMVIILSNTIFRKIP